MCDGRTVLVISRLLMFGSHNPGIRWKCGFRCPNLPPTLHRQRTQESTARAFQLAPGLPRARILASALVRNDATFKPRIFAAPLTLLPVLLS